LKAAFPSEKQVAYIVSSACGKGGQTSGVLGGRRSPGHWRWRHVIPIQSGARRPRPEGFTLLEVLAASAVFAVLLVITLSALGYASLVWRSSSAKIEAFQAARGAFDLVTRNLSQAVLNTYIDYDDENRPSRYLRKSDLRFVCGPAGGTFPGDADTGQALFFQLPGNYTAKTANFGGLESLLNTCGYFVAFSDDPMKPPHLSGSGKHRFRLMQLLVPTEKNRIFSVTGPLDYTWFKDYTKAGDFGSNVLPVAENVIALVIEPADPDPKSAVLAPDYTYNTGIDGIGANERQIATAHQLPPTVKVTMVAIDEASAQRLEQGQSPPDFLVGILKGKFQKADKYAQDLSDLKTALAGQNIQFRIFSSAVPIRESKWTK
jgi:uncharacterized protein (TIGR02599 family)